MIWELGVVAPLPIPDLPQQQEATGREETPPVQGASLSSRAFPGKAVSKLILSPPETPPDPLRSVGGPAWLLELPVKERPVRGSWQGPRAAQRAVCPVPHSCSMSLPFSVTSCRDVWPTDL